MLCTLKTKYKNSVKVGSICRKFTWLSLRELGHYCSVLWLLFVFDLDTNMLQVFNSNLLLFCMKSDHEKPCGSLHLGWWTESPCRPAPITKLSSRDISKTVFNFF
jgi:hypothetical protein